MLIALNSLYLFIFILDHGLLYLNEGLHLPNLYEICQDMPRQLLKHIYHVYYIGWYYFISDKCDRYKHKLNKHIAIFLMCCHFKAFIIFIY